MPEKFRLFRPVSNSDCSENFCQWDNIEKKQRPDLFYLYIEVKKEHSAYYFYSKLLDDALVSLSIMYIHILLFLLML